AYENSLIYKERTKKLHDEKIKNRIFNVGDQVLLFNSRLKIFSVSPPRWLQLQTELSSPQALSWRRPTTVGDSRRSDFPSGQLNTGIESSPRLGLSPEIEVFLCWNFFRFSRSSYPLIDSSLGRVGYTSAIYDPCICLCPHVP
nr:reverse transcriptase domain-containing protein [Tanacetum cinerariifolium]